MNSNNEVDNRRGHSIFFLLQKNSVNELCIYVQKDLFNEYSLAYLFVFELMCS